MAKKGPLPPMAQLGDGIFAKLDQRFDEYEYKPAALPRRGLDEHTSAPYKRSNRRADEPPRSKAESTQYRAPPKSRGSSRQEHLKHFDVDMQLPTNCKLLGYLGRIQEELKVVVLHPEPCVPPDEFLTEPAQDVTPENRSRLALNVIEALETQEMHNPLHARAAAPHLLQSRSVSPQRRLRSKHRERSRLALEDIEVPEFQEMQNTVRARIAAPRLLLSRSCSPQRRLRSKHRERIEEHDVNSQWREDRNDPRVMQRSMVSRQAKLGWQEDRDDFPILEERRLECQGRRPLPIEDYQAESDLGDRGRWDFSSNLRIDG